MDNRKKYIVTEEEKSTILSKHSDFKRLLEIIKNADKSLIKEGTVDFNQWVEDVTNNCKIFTGITESLLVQNDKECISVVADSKVVLPYWTTEVPGLVTAGSIKENDLVEVYKKGILKIYELVSGVYKQKGEPEGYPWSCQFLEELDEKCKQNYSDAENLLTYKQAFRDIDKTTNRPRLEINQTNTYTRVNKKCGNKITTFYKPVGSQGISGEEGLITKDQFENYKKFREKYNIDSQTETKEVYNPKTESYIEQKKPFPTDWISLKQPDPNSVREYQKVFLPDEYNVNNQPIPVWVRKGDYLKRFQSLVSTNQKTSIKSSTYSDKDCIQYLKTYFGLYQTQSQEYPSPNPQDKLGAQSCVSKEDNWQKGDFTNDRFANNIIKFFTGKQLVDYGRKGGKVGDDGSLDGFYPPRQTRDGTGWGLRPKTFQAR